MITPRVLAIVPKDSDGCLLWRNWWPLAELRKHDFVADWLYVTKFREDVVPALSSGKYNIVVTPRFVFREPWMLQRFTHLLSQSDVAWIYELDDDMFSPDLVERQVQFTKYMRNPGSSLNAISAEEMEIRERTQMEYERSERIRLIGLVDGTTTSTEPLAQITRSYTDAPVHVVPNAMDITWFQEHMRRWERTIPPLTIGYSGGWRLWEDVQPMAEAWGRIAKRFPEVNFIFHGWSPKDIVATIPANRLHILPWTDIENYPAVIKNIDIACCSVANNSWNLCKTTIKWQEMSMAGAAVVATHALYEQDILNEHDGLLATTVDEWEAQLARLVVDTRLRKNIVSNAQYAIQEEHNLAYAWPQWVNAWSSILKYRQARGIKREMVAI